SPGHGQRLGQLHQASLGGTVTRHHRHAEIGGHGGDADNIATEPAVREQAPTGMGQTVSATQMHLYRTFEQLRIIPYEGRTAIVDQYVQTTERGRHLLDLPVIGDIQVQIAVLTQILVIVACSRPGAGDDHLGSGCVIGCGDAGTDTTGTTSDEHRATTVVVVDVVPAGFIR